MWGVYKEQVDELTMEMNKNPCLFEELKITLNDQITLLSNTKARFAMMLSEATSMLLTGRRLRPRNNGRRKSTRTTSTS